MNTSDARTRQGNFIFLSSDAFYTQEKRQRRKEKLAFLFFIYSEIKYVYVLVSLHIRKAKEEMNNAIAK